MMKIKFNILTIVILYGYHVAALEFKQCSIKNSTCQQNLFQTVARDHAPRGIPEIGVPILDPFHLKNVIIYVLKYVKLELIEGDCLGISTCRLLKYETRLRDFHKIAVINCARVVIQGSYRISTHPNNYRFGHASGYGNMSIVLEDWFFTFDYPFRFIRHEDGEIYTKPYFDFTEYTSVVLKSATVTADNIMWNNQDVTAEVLAYINNNWWEVLTKYSKSFHDKCIDYYYEMYNKFFDNIPATKYMSDDLTQYL